MNVLQENFQSSPLDIIWVQDSVIFPKLIDFTYLRTSYSFIPPCKVTFYTFEHSTFPSSILRFFASLKLSLPVILLISITSPCCGQWKIWFGRWDICWGKVHKWFTTALSAAVWARKKLWRLVMKNNQKIAQSISRFGVVASSPLLTKDVASRWWDRQLTAATRTKAALSWIRREQLTLPCFKFPKS